MTKYSSFRTAARFVVGASIILLVGILGVFLWLHFMCPYVSFSKTCVVWEISMLDAGNALLLKLYKGYNLILMTFYHVLHDITSSIIKNYERVSFFGMALDSLKTNQ